MFGFQHFHLECVKFLLLALADGVVLVFLQFVNLQREFAEVIHELSVVVNKDGNYVMSGLEDVETFNEEYGYSLTESDEYETIAGYIMYFSGNFPKMGEIVTINDNDVSYRFRILEIKGTKIVKVMLYAE